MPEGVRDPEFFGAFEWPLPVSFGAAVAACRFEQGDVLYRDIRAYGAWSEPLPRGLDAIQILAPPRSTRGALSEGDSDRRRSNWGSEVRILLVDPTSGNSEERVVTQGKLLMALWTGSEDWLSQNRAEPEFPRSARELQANLDQARGAMSKRASRRKVRSGSQFVLVVDLASDASRTKAALVEEQLASGGRVDRVDLLPGEAGIETPDVYHPTLVLRVFTLAGRDQEEVGSELRTCLYQGQAGSSRAAPSEIDESESATSTSDRFSVARHGLLVSI